MPNPFDLFTLDYRRFRPDLGVPVRTSNGYPRFVRYRIPYVVREAAPDRSLMQVQDRDEFAVLYRQQLEGHGRELFEGRFAEIAEEAGDSRLVLLCFEDLAKPGLWCHRTVFAEIWEDWTGNLVRELGPTGGPSLW